MPKFYTNLARKISKNPNFYVICPQKINKIPEFYVILPEKYIFTNSHAPLPPISYTYVCE